MLRMNHQTKLIRFTWLIVIVAVGFGFELQCPKPSQWSFRKHVCGTPEKYSCLYDIEKRIYEESCLENTDFVKAGKRYVIWGGRDSYDCSDSRYQPRKYWSNVTSDCEMLKRTCCEEGQVTVSDGSTTEDRACRCDLLNGFGFITRQAGSCSCIPSQEDCNCYRIKFAESEIHTEENECVNDSNMLEVAEKNLLVEESELKLESPFSTETAMSLYNLDQSGLIVLTVLLSMNIFLACIASLLLTFGWDEKLDFKFMFLCNGEVRRTINNKDLYAKKVISNWKALKSSMNRTEVMIQLSNYRFMDTLNLQKQKLWLKYPEDCILKFIAEKSFEIVEHIRWYNAQNDILFQIPQMLLVEPPDVDIDRTDMRKQELHLISNRPRLLKFMHMESDDIIDCFIEHFIFELSDMEKIREKSYKMNKRFLETIIYTLNKGSYRLLLHIMKENKTCCPLIPEILEELKNDEVKSPNIEVMLMKGTLHNEYTDQVTCVLFDIRHAEEEIYLTKQGIMACASSFMEVLGLFPKIKTITRTGVHLDVVCFNMLQRIENSIVRGTMTNLVKHLCIQYKLGTGSHVFDITLSVPAEDETTDIMNSETQPLNIILANRSFLIDEIDTDIITKGLKNEIDEEYKKKINELHERIPKAEIICDFLQRKAQTIIEPLFAILRENEMHIVLDRLQAYQQTFNYSKDSNQLRNAMIMHFKEIVSSLYSNCLLNDVIAILQERNLLKGNIPDMSFSENMSEELAIAECLVHLMKLGRNAMLHFVDTLYALEETTLAKKILRAENDLYLCTASDVEMERRLNKEQLSDGICFVARFSLTVTPGTVD